MEFVTIKAIIYMYERADGELRNIDSHFFRGFWFLALWLVILAVLGLFIYSFFFDWRIPTVILGILIAIEIITAIGRKLEK